MSEEIITHPEKIYTFSEHEINEIKEFIKEFRELAKERFRSPYMEAQDDDAILDIVVDIEKILNK